MTPLRWVRWVLLMVIARIASWLGCYVVRDEELNEVVQVLSHMGRIRHAHPLGRKGSARRSEDDYLAYCLMKLRWGVVPRRTRTRVRTASGR